MPGSGYSAALVSLVTQMLSEQPDRRPSASEILQSPAIRNYVSTVLLTFSYKMLRYRIELIETA